MEEELKPIDKSDLGVMMKRSLAVFRELMLASGKLEDSLMCTIHDVFPNISETGHNCLGCNLQDDVILIERFLEHAMVFDYAKAKEDGNGFYPPPGRSDVFRVYASLLNLLNEKILEVFILLGIKNNYFNEPEFRGLRVVRHWTNFFKHPKGFILTHHPNYTFDPPGIIDKKSSFKYLDYKFIFDYYMAGNEFTREQTIEQLRQKKDFVVVLPQLDFLTKEFCEGCIAFVEMLKNSPEYQSKLEEYSTMENFIEEHSPGLPDKLVWDRFTKKDE